jgi:excisionase family DNA binding protein
LSLSADAVELIAERASEIALELLSVAPTGSPYMTVAEAAERMRAKPQRVYDLLSAHRLTRYEDGRRTLVSREEIDGYLAGEGQNRVAPAWLHTPKARLNKRAAA